MAETKQDQAQQPGVANEMRGTFVESAFTQAQIDRAILEEKRLGLDEKDCAFLAGQTGPFNNLPRA
jgi:hypothetical protein